METIVMEITWFGQAGYLFQTLKHTNILIDPYLSNSLEKSKGETFKRQIPICEDIFDIPVDVLILTHIHGDHTDIETLDRIMSKKTLMVLAPSEVCNFLLQRYGNNMNVADAYRFFCAAAPKKVFPMHWDMFYSYGCDVNNFCVLLTDEEQKRL